MAMTIAELKRKLHRDGIKTYYNKKTKTSYAKKADVLKYVKAGQADRDKLLEENTGGDNVDAASKAASSGHWLDRYLGIAEAAGHEYAKHLANLKALMDDFGARPDGLDKVAEDVMGSVVWGLISEKNWNRDDLNRIAWGLPQRIIKDYKLERSSGGDREDM